jgi:hypothetical protein
MAQGVGGEFGHDEFSKLCLLGEPLCGEGLTDQFASVSEFSWIIGNSPGNAGLACQGRGHAVLLALELSAADADCLAVWHGPVPSGPAFGVDERRHIVAHLQRVAERGDRRTAEELLLARQAYYLLGFDTSAETMAWLARMYRADRQAVRPVPGWSPSWPLARSTASALTRLGDPEPMRRFIADQLCNEAGECANLNYWAFWGRRFR